MKDVFEICLIWEATVFDRKSLCNANPKNLQKLPSYGNFLAECISYLSTPTPPLPHIQRAHIPNKHFNPVGERMMGSWNSRKRTFWPWQSQSPYITCRCSRNISNVFPLFQLYRGVCQNRIFITVFFFPFSQTKSNLITFFYQNNMNWVEK